MYIYNSLTRQKELLTPLEKNRVKMYVCGPTVYDRAHIGNARPVVVFDTLFRLLKRSCEVTYVRNITDVDDKIIQAAEKNQESIEQLTRRTTEQFHEDMDALNALPVSLEPRATEHIPEMIELIRMLIEKGHAYEKEGHVLFDTLSDATYGSLARRDLEEMIAGARVEVAPYKKNTTDFVLWKPSPSSIPGWESPWGRGRPGWHIECSAMSHKHLGQTFDIHGGGIDIIFPHHENEVAQSSCAFGKNSFAQRWMHNGMLMVNGKKMSKSLGNFFTVHELLSHYPGEVIRLTLLSTHYRQPLDWTEAAAKHSKSTLDKFYTALKGVSLYESEAEASFLQALEDDLNTPLALSILHELANAIHKSTDISEKTHLASQLKSSANMLGLLYQDPDAWFKSGASSLSSAEIEALISQRLQARQSKNYAEADRIRQLLDSKNVILEDSSEGTSWKLR